MGHLKMDFLVLEKLVEDCLPEVAAHIQAFSTWAPPLPSLPLLPRMVGVQAPGY